MGISMDYKKRLDETYQLTAQGQLEAFKKYLADDVVWTESVGFPYAGTYVGPDAVVENVHMKLGTEWEGYQAVPKAYTFNGQEVMVYGQYSGTFKATGKSFVTDFVHYYVFNSEHKVAKFTQIVESVPVLEAMK